MSKNSCHCCILFLFFPQDKKIGTCFLTLTFSFKGTPVEKKIWKGKSERNYKCLIKYAKIKKKHNKCFYRQDNSLSWIMCFKVDLLAGNGAANLVILWTVWSLSHRIVNVHKNYLLTEKVNRKIAHLTGSKQKPRETRSVISVCRSVFCLWCWGWFVEFWGKVLDLKFGKQSRKPQGINENT